MPHENIFQSNRKRKSQRIKRNCLKYFLISTVFLSSFYIPLWIGVSLAAINGLVMGSFLRKSRELDTPPNTLKNHDLTDKIQPGDVARYTTLGMAYDFRHWKEMRTNIDREYGIVDRGLLRDLEHILFPKMKPLAISDQSLNQHLAMIMPSGGGKSEAYKSMLLQFIARGSGLIAMELKGTLVDFVGIIYRMCEETNRLDDLRIIALDQPDFSHSYSPIAQGSTRGMISQLGGLQGQSKEEFFDAVSRFGTTAQVLALRLQPGAPRFRMSDVAAMLSDLDLLREKIRCINPNESEEHKSGYHFLLIYLNYWRVEDEWNYREYKNRMLGLMQTLLDYCHSEYNSIVNVYEPDVILREAITEGKIIVFTASTNIDEKGVNRMTRLMVENLIQVAGELERENIKAPIPCPLLLEEYRGMRDPSQIKMWQLFRSIRMPIILNVQNAKMIDDPNDASFYSGVLGNIDTMITGRAKDEDTQKLFALRAGSFINKLRTETVSNSASSGHSSDTSGLVTQTNNGMSQSGGYRESNEDLISIDDLNELEDGQFIVISREGVYRVIGPMTVTRPSPTWDEMKLVRFKRAQSDEHGIYETYVKGLERTLLQ